MLSNKMTVSLMSLITILALVFVSSATAGVLGEDFTTTISLMGTAGTEIEETSGGSITIKVAFGKPVNLVTNLTHDPDADPPVTADFAAEEITLMAFDKTSGAEITGAAVTNFTASTTPTDSVDVTLTGLSFDDATSAGLRVLVKVPEGAATNADPADVFKANTVADDSLGMNAEGTLTFDVVPIVTERPSVFDIERPGVVTGEDTFAVTILLTAMPKELKKDHIEASNATVVADPIALNTKTVYRPNADNTSLVGTMVYPYIAEIKPKYESKDDIVITVKPYETTGLAPKMSLKSMAYSVKVTTDKNKKVGLSGTKKDLPKDIIIPNGGYLVVPKDVDMSYITNPGDPKKGAADIARRVEAKNQTYNMVALDLGIDLEGFLIRGGTIDLVSPNAGLVISEIMWGTDAGSRDRQWIEIANTSGGKSRRRRKRATQRRMKPLPSCCMKPVRHCRI